MKLIPSKIDIELDFNLMEEPEYYSERWKYEEEKYRKEFERQKLIKTRKEKLQKLDNI